MRPKGRVAVVEQSRWRGRLGNSAKTRPAAASPDDGLIERSAVRTGRHPGAARSSPRGPAAIHRASAGRARARSRRARAFGEDGAFEAKILLAGGVSGAARASAPGRWSQEVEKSTSAPARRQPRAVKATDAAMLDTPFLYWSGTGRLSQLSSGEIAGLRKFFALAGSSWSTTLRETSSHARALFHDV